MHITFVVILSNNYMLCCCIKNKGKHNHVHILVSYRFQSSETLNLEMYSVLYIKKYIIEYI